MTFWPEIASFVANSNAILSIGGVGLLSAVGVVPKVGVIRALTVNFRSYFNKAHPLSVRKVELEELTNRINAVAEGYFTVVVGAKGIGKSTIIDTMLNKQRGVMKISIQSGDDQDVIVHGVLRQINGIQLLSDPIDTAHRVLFFHSFFFKFPPIVVIKVPERMRGKQYANVPAAARELAEDYGLRVIVVGPPNSYPREIIRSSRANHIIIHPMLKEDLESIPEFQELFCVLKSHNLFEAVWRVFGGMPEKYVTLKTVIKAYPADKIVDVVKSHIQSVLVDALGAILTSSLAAKEIIKTFRQKNTLICIELKAEGVSYFSSEVVHEIFYEVYMDGGIFLQPTSNAIGLIISEKVEYDIVVDTLMEKLFKVQDKYW